MSKTNFLFHINYICHTFFSGRLIRTDTLAARCFLTSEFKTRIFRRGLNSPYCLRGKPPCPLSFEWERWLFNLKLWVRKWAYSISRKLPCVPTIYMVTDKGRCFLNLINQVLASSRWILCTQIVHSPLQSGSNHGATRQSSTTRFEN